MLKVFDAAEPKKEQDFTFHLVPMLGRMTLYVKAASNDNGKPFEYSVLEFRQEGDKLFAKLASGLDPDAFDVVPDSRNELRVR